MFLPQDFYQGGGRIRGKREFESGIMKQFTIDLITVKSHSNYPGANKGNPLNITRGKKKNPDKDVKVRAASECRVVGRTNQF